VPTGSEIATLDCAEGVSAATSTMTTLISIAARPYCSSTPARASLAWATSRCGNSAWVQKWQDTSPRPCDTQREGVAVRPVTKEVDLAVDGTGTRAAESGGAGATSSGHQRPNVAHPTRPWYEAIRQREREAAADPALGDLNPVVELVKCEPATLRARGGAGGEGISHSVARLTVSGRGLGRGSRGGGGMPAVTVEGGGDARRGGGGGGCGGGQATMVPSLCSVVFMLGILSVGLVGKILV
jgi:hypothetical protein